ncbi:MAG: uracil-DNA glycosylase [Gammaproteobacteria bacterium]|nr:uracil-DNA glycosylase [Gammaproteobacteria bacterium]
MLLSEAKTGCLKVGRGGAVRRQFNPGCRRCHRLVKHLEEVRSVYPSYHARPVGPFGSRAARLLVVGLAPGLHGANRTGRPFTGDIAGVLLYKTLFIHGFSNRPDSKNQGDGLVLSDCRITNAVKCLPPENRPTTAEIGNCNAYLCGELSTVPRGGVILALGHLAHGAVLKGFGLSRGQFPFAHGRAFQLFGDRWLLDSYHCSRYNLQTGRLTEAAFMAVFDKAHDLIAHRY